MDTTDNYWTEFLTVRNTVFDMLEKRGFESSQLNRDADIDFLRRQFDMVQSSIAKSLELNIGAYTCDIFVKDANRRSYVHFIFNPKETQYSLEKRIAKIADSHGLVGERDDIDIVVFRRNMDSDSLLYSVEKSDKHSVRVFYYKSLMFDITKHSLVPRHTLVPKSEHARLKKELMITHFNQLPTLLVSDAVSRFYHYRRGSVIEIERPSVGNMKHIAYRYVL
jgi:DNA-directed RNA polymerase subunit H (RpoH/RPB5)